MCLRELASKRIMTQVNRTEKLIKYISEMYGRSEEYDVDITRPVEEIDSESEIGQVFNEIAKDKICTVCEKQKMFDERNNEFYCPIHDI